MIVLMELTLQTCQSGGAQLVAMGGQLHEHDHHDHHDHHAHHGEHEHHKRCAHGTICEALDFPSRQAFLGPTNYYVGEALAGFVKAGEHKKRNPNIKPKQAPPCLIIAGGSMIETILACLTA